MSARALDADFAHFLSYSNLSGESADVLAKLRLAYAANWKARPVASDLVIRLREYADEPGYSHNDYADTMKEAADEIERKLGTLVQPATAPVANDVCAEMRALCSACGGTGDVHSVTGEWRGSCDCEASAWSRPAAAPLSGWISVDARLPDDAAHVAIFDRDNTDMPVRTAQWLAGSATFESECGWLAKDEVSHWMPLPLPPTVEGEAK